MSHANTSVQLNVIARSPFEVHYEGAADAVTATNKVGEFDILPGHADFFSMLTPCDVIIRTSGEPIVVPITNGIITVRDNEALLFINM